MKGKPLYVEFIDFQNVFDSVDRSNLYDVFKTEWY